MPEPTCPCGTKLPFTACCKPYLDGTVDAAMPELLMRSRYTAFTRGDFAYLKRTWHPETVPTLGAEETGKWVGLEIVETGVDESGEHGRVEFIAKLIVGDQLAILHEVSAFEKIGGLWVYRSGTFKNAATQPAPISMKAPCPCGSGEKFKRCHSLKWAERHPRRR